MRLRQGDHDRVQGQPVSNLVNLVIFSFHKYIRKTPVFLLGFSVEFWCTKHYLEADARSPHWLRMFLGGSGESSLRVGTERSRRSRTPGQ